MEPKTLDRYNPAAVVLHWLTVPILLGAGLLSEEEGGGSSPIDIHMILGVALLVVMVIRLLLRLRIRRPLWASTGNPFFDKLGELVHLGLYVFTFWILVFGGLIAMQRNLIGYVLGSGSVAHGRIGIFGSIHHFGWIAVILLLILHIGAALYHQFIVKDSLLRRMWFGV